MNEEKIYRRISDLEVLVNKYHDQIQNYLQHIASYDSLIKKSQEQGKNNDQLENKFIEKIDSLYYDLFVSKKQVEDLNKNLSEHKEEYKKNLCNIVDQNKIFSEMHQRHENNFVVNDSNLADVNKKIQEFRHIPDDISKIHEKIDTSIEDLKKNDSDILEMHAKLSQRLESNRQDLQVYSMNQDKIRNQKIEEDQKKEKQIELNFKSLENKIFEIENSINNRISSLKLSETTQLPDFQKLVDDAVKKALDSIEAPQKTIPDTTDPKLTEIHMTLINKKLDSLNAILSNLNLK